MPGNLAGKMSINPNHYLYSNTFPMRQTLIFAAVFFFFSLFDHGTIQQSICLQYLGLWRRRRRRATLNTTAIQSAVDSCSRHGGGRVIVPAGNFVTGSVRLFSNIEFYLEAGARLIGSPDNRDYLHQKDFGFSGPGAGSRTGILFAHDAE